MSAVIQAQGLGKRYRLGEGGYATLREQIGRRRLRPDADPELREVWALRDVDLEIEEGDVVGIVGRNGAGKTTLLKSVARIVRPTTGVVRMRGRVGSLLEVGTGFHPELTGRENVFLNGVVLGMSRREIERRFDDIVEFSGVERFLDTPLKRYSSGMYLRLAFAVAAHVDPDILIVDEVLAVGDAEFRRRCLGRMTELGREGRTVLFVSHDTGVVGQLCRRAIWLERGRVRDEGPVGAVLSAYLRDVATGTATAAIEAVDGAPIGDVSVGVRDRRGVHSAVLPRDEPVTLCVAFTALARATDLDVSVYLINEGGLRVINENASDTDVALTSHVGTRREARVEIPPVLPAGDYVVGVWLGNQEETFVHGEALTLSVLPLPTDRSRETRGVARPPVHWTVEECRAD